jgi:hypothetical protein
MPECVASSLLGRAVFIFMAKKSSTSAGLIDSEEEGVNGV